MAEISKLNGYDLKDKQSRADIAGIKNGTIQAKNAEHAITSSRAYHADGAGEADYYIVTNDEGANTSELIIHGKFSEVEQTIQNVANGVNRGYSFDSVDMLIGDLQGQKDNTKYKIGDELYIKSADKPDYWVAEVKDEKGHDVGGVFEDGATVGYWVLYKLGEKTDLTLYQTKTDTGLNTTAKRVVSAVNEVKRTADDAKEVAYEVSDKFLGLILNDNPDGTCDLNITAEKARGDENGSNIRSTYIKSITASGRTITYTKGNGTTGTITTQDTTYAQATSTVLGLVKIGYTASGRNYPVVLDADGKMYVNIPWTDTVYTLPVATTTVRGGVKVGAVRSTAVTTNAASSTDGRYYMVERDSAEKLFVNIPWQNTTYGLATQSANGLMSTADKMKLDHIRISVTGEEMTITLS